MRSDQNLTSATHPMGGVNFNLTVSPRPAQKRARACRAHRPRSRDFALTLSSDVDVELNQRPAT